MERPYALRTLGATGHVPKNGLGYTKKAPGYPGNPAVPTSAVGLQCSDRLQQIESHALGAQVGLVMTFRKMCEHWRCPCSTWTQISTTPLSKWPVQTINIESRPDWIRTGYTVIRRLPLQQQQRVPCRVVSCCVVLCRAMPCHAMPCHAVPFHSMRVRAAPGPRYYLRIESGAITGFKTPSAQPTSLDSFSPPLSVRHAFASTLSLMLTSHSVHSYPRVL